jgi:UDP-glucose 4-epimerase
MSAGTGHVLVTGGAGYIGSHVVLALRDLGREVTVVDNLVTGVREAVPEDVPFVEGNVGDSALLGEVFDGRPIDAVMHFAGSIVVPESVANPAKYYRNNSMVSLTLIEQCLRANVQNFVFSSTAAVYGIPESNPIAEDAPTKPINPYGTSKLVTEFMLRDIAKTGALRFAAPRYFNVAGADAAKRSGQSTPEATHLIKVACQTALGLRGPLEVFGDDYDTPDGTCVRDYIHVSDLASAHVALLDHLRGGGESAALNLGYGRGFSVREVIDALETEIGRPVPHIMSARRAGDPPALVADPSRLKGLVAWKPNHDDLGTIVRTAYEWESRLAAASH